VQRSMSGTALIAGRRRTADYDISNVVSSVSVGRKTVEQLQHTKIETPRWRLVQQMLDELVREDSSDEVSKCPDLCYLGLVGPANVCSEGI
jgi:hypothetical protein